ncbi:MAG: dUTP diphosphatase [Candidatus Cloacimonetes bacterium]|nr:dUTP diphosphatase [Candidatus Cloacimonadota bacterium]
MAKGLLRVDIHFLSKTAKKPEKMSNFAAGYDIYADIDEDIELKPMARTLIPTGFALSLPKNLEAQIRARSGLAINHGITVLNSPGTIDSDYRGEVKVILINLSDKDFTIQKNMRIAQMILTQHESVDFVEVQLLDQTERGEGGFGHTSLK